MGGVAASRIISRLLLSLGWVLAAGLSSAPALQAFEAFDGRLQAHGFFESQLRVLSEDFSDNWDVVQWYNVFDLELEADIIQDTWGPIDLLSAYVRAEVRFDCVYSRGCGMFRSVNAYGDRSKSLPGRLNSGDEVKSAGVLVIENEGSYNSGRDPMPLGDLAGFKNISDIDPPEILDRFGDVVIDQYVAALDVPGVPPEDMYIDFEDKFGIAPWDYTFEHYLDFRFTMISSVGGSNGGYPSLFMGPWLPKNFFETRAILSDRVNPFDSSRINPVVYNPFPFQEYTLWDPDDLERPNLSRPDSDATWGSGWQSVPPMVPDEWINSPYRPPVSGDWPILDTVGNLRGDRCLFGFDKKGCHGGPGSGANPYRPIPIYAEDESEWNQGDARFNDGTTIPYKLGADGRPVMLDQQVLVRITSDITAGDRQVNRQDEYKGSDWDNPDNPWLAVKGESAQNPWDARGIFVPSPPLVKWMQSGDFDTFEFNFRQAERAWNRGASQQDTKELKEAYFDAEFLDSRLWIRAGLQQIIWGKTELFRTTDQFNPQDLALASLPSLEEARIGQWAVRGVYSLYEVGPLSDVRLELAFNMDDYEPNDLGACGEAYTPNLVCMLTFGGLAHGFTGLGVAGVDRPPSPWESLEGWEIGGRIEFRWDRFSFAISDFYGYDDFPYIERISTYQRNVDPYTGLPLLYDGRSPEERRAKLAEPVYFRTAEEASTYAEAHGGVLPGQPEVGAGDINPWRVGCAVGGQGGDPLAARTTTDTDGLIAVDRDYIVNGVRVRTAAVSVLTGECLTAGPTDLTTGFASGVDTNDRELAVRPDTGGSPDPRPLTSYLNYDDRNRWRTNYVARDANGRLLFPEDCEATNSCYPIVDVNRGRATNALYSHPGNQTLFTFVCSTTVGMLPDVDRRACALTAFGSDAKVSGITVGMAINNLLAGKPEMNAALTLDAEAEAATYIPPGQDPFRQGEVWGSKFIPFPLPIVTLDEGPADGDSLGCRDPHTGASCGSTDTTGTTNAEKFLSDHLSPEQEALLGCGPFWGTNCEDSGVDLLNAEPSALLQSFAGFDGSDVAVNLKRDQGIGADAQPWTGYDWADVAEFRTDEGLQPGTLAWEVSGIGGPLCTTADIGGPMWDSDWDQSSTNLGGAYNLPAKNVQLAGCRRKWVDIERTTKVEEEINFRTNRFEVDTPIGSRGDPKPPAFRACEPGDTAHSDIVAIQSGNIPGVCRFITDSDDPDFDSRFLNPDQYHTDEFYSVYDGNPDWLATANAPQFSFPDSVYTQRMSSVLSPGDETLVPQRPSYFSTRLGRVITCDVGETMAAERPLPSRCYSGHPLASKRLEDLEEQGLTDRTEDLVVPFSSELAGLSWNFEMVVTAFSSEFGEGLRTIGDLADPLANYAYDYRDSRAGDKMLGGSNPDMTPDYDGDGEIYNKPGPDYRGPRPQSANNDTFFLDSWYKDASGRPIADRCQDPSGRPAGVHLPAESPKPGVKQSSTWFHCNKDADDQQLAQIYSRRRYIAQLLFAYCGDEYGTGTCKIEDRYNEYQNANKVNVPGIEDLRTLMSGIGLPFFPASYVPVDARASCFKKAKVDGLDRDSWAEVCGDVLPDSTDYLGYYIVSDPTEGGGSAVNPSQAYLDDADTRQEYLSSLQYVTTRSDCSLDNPEQEGCVWARSDDEDDHFKFLQNIPGKEDDAYLITNEHCGFITPQYCGLVQSMFNVAGVKRNTVRAGGNGTYGRRTMQWHSGGEVVLRYDKRNVLGFAMDFTEDRTKTNFGVEFTWIGGVPNTDNGAWDNVSNTDDFNMTVSVDRPTFINFLNANRTFFFNSQWFFQYRNGYKQSFPGNGPWNVLATFTAMTGYFQDRLNPALTFVHDFQSVSGAVLPSVAYRFDENFSATIGAMFFYGRSQYVQMPINGIGTASNRSGPRAYQDAADNGLALVRDRDEVFVRLRYTF